MYYFTNAANMDSSVLPMFILRKVIVYERPHDGGTGNIFQDEETAFCLLDSVYFTFSPLANSL